MMTGVMAADTQAKETQDVSACLRGFRRAERQGCRNRYECQPWTTHSRSLQFSRAGASQPIARLNIRSGIAP
jgi:hypothetical protein